MSDQIIVNGNTYSWGSIVLRFGGDPFTGVTGISFGDKLERAKAIGMGKARPPRGRTAGKYTVEPVKITMFKGSAQILREALAEAASDGRTYSSVLINITVQYNEAESGSNEVPILIQLLDCTVASDLSSNEEGPDPSKDEVELDCMRIIRNNVTLYDSSLGY